MNYTKSKPELLALVKALIANPDMEFPLNAAGKPHGLTQKQQVSIIMNLLVEAVFTDATPQQFADGFQIVYDWANGSAARQGCEKLGLLAESPGGKRGADVAALAMKYMPKGLGA